MCPSLARKSKKVAKMGFPEIHTKTQPKQPKKCHEMPCRELATAILLDYPSSRHIVCYNTHMVLCYTHHTTYATIFPVTHVSQPAYEHECVLHWPESRTKCSKSRQIGVPRNTHKITTKMVKIPQKCPVESWQPLFY